MDVVLLVGCVTQMLHLSARSWSSIQRFDFFLCYNGVRACIVDPSNLSSRRPVSFSLRSVTLYFELVGSVRKSGRVRGLNTTSQFTGAAAHRASNVGTTPLPRTRTASINDNIKAQCRDERMPSVILSIVILHLPQKISTLNAIPNSFESQCFPYPITQDHHRCIKQTVLLFLS
jgi:hypothetical protein